MELLLAAPPLEEAQGTGGGARGPRQCCSHPRPPAAHLPQKPEPVLKPFGDSASPIVAGAARRHGPADRRRDARAGGDGEGHGHGQFRALRNVEAKKRWSSSREGDARHRGTQTLHVCLARPSI